MTSPQSCNQVGIQYSVSLGTSDVDMSVLANSSGVYAKTYSAVSGGPYNDVLTFLQQASGTTIQVSGVLSTNRGFTYFSGSYTCVGKTNESASTRGIIPFNDGRLNSLGQGDPVALYTFEDEDSYGLTVWVIDADSVGHLGLTVTAADLAGLPDKPDHAIVIASSEDGFVTVYKLPSGEYQVNAGPDKEGKVFVYILDALPPTHLQTQTYNINDPLVSSFALTSL